MPQAESLESKTRSSVPECIQKEREAFDQKGMVMIAHKDNMQYHFWELFAEPGQVMI